MLKVSKRTLLVFYIYLCTQSAFLNKKSLNHCRKGLGKLETLYRTSIDPFVCHKSPGEHFIHFIATSVADRVFKDKNVYNIM